MAVNFLRRWNYETYFGGPSAIDVSLETTEDEVRKMLDQKHFGGNWRTNTLKRGGKFKDRSKK